MSKDNEPKKQGKGTPELRPYQLLHPSVRPVNADDSIESLLKDALGMSVPAEQLQVHALIVRLASLIQ